MPTVPPNPSAAPAAFPAAAPAAGGKPAPPPPLPPVKLDFVAPVLSYLVPGLGQVYQGRVGKGLLFFFSLYALFFYGMWMGQWQNVWLPDATRLPEVEISTRVFTWKADGMWKALAYRPQFGAQFFIGVAAWPAVAQYRATELPADPDATPEPNRVFGRHMQAPTEKKLNELQRDGNKRWDLGWVYTVIAGILNLLVIYDAFAGPMFRDPPPDDKKPSDPTPTGPPDPLANGAPAGPNGGAA